MFDYFLKSILTVIPLIKTQFFYPLSTNLLYWTCWTWIHSPRRNSVQIQPLQMQLLVSSKFYIKKYICLIFHRIRSIELKLFFFFLTSIKSYKQSTQLTPFFYTKFKFYSSLIYVYTCVKLPFGDLNLDPYPPHPTNMYTYKVIIAPRVCGEDWPV